MINEEKAKSLVGCPTNVSINEWNGEEYNKLGFEYAMEMAKWKDEQLNEELNLIAEWFSHIAQMADDKKTLSGAVMKDSDAFDEIKCLAKRCAEYVDKRLLNI